ncbi:MAG: serine hydrolase domain-containing protein [Rubrivivax sp.]
MRLKMKRFWCLWVCALTVACPSVQADEIDRFAAQTLRVYGVPGLVVGVYRDGRLVSARALGQAQLELKVKARVDHVFEIGSISKQFTAYAVLMLAERGQVELNAPVGRYLSGLPESWSGISLHQLLTHTSGLPDLEEAFGYAIYRETYSDAEFGKRLFALPLNFEAGEKWAYSNTNYWLLARVIEQVSNLRYADFMATQIFKPLGMRSTRSSLPSELLPGRAAGYQRLQGRIENRDAMQPSTARGLGDIATTLADLARWEAEQLSPHLISARSAALATEAVHLNDGTTSPYGYGWFIEQRNGERVLQHAGETAGFTSAYLRLPGRQVAVAVFSNLHGAPVEVVARIALAQFAPQMRDIKPHPIADEDPAATARLRRVLSTATQARGQWREEWFGAEQWKSMQAWLVEVETAYEGRGPLRSLVPVRAALDAVAGTRRYRAVFAHVSRLVSVTEDEHNRIKSFRGVDE